MTEPTIPVKMSHEDRSGKRKIIYAMEALLMSTCIFLNRGQQIKQSEAQEWDHCRNSF